MQKKEIPFSNTFSSAIMKKESGQKEDICIYFASGRR
jgi:hypothetical protein